MSLRHSIDAALFLCEGVKIATTVGSPLPEMEETSRPLGSPTASNQMTPQEYEAAAHKARRALIRRGAPQELVAPLPDAPEADPVMLKSVIQRARKVRDPSDYLRVLSGDPDINEIARMSALPVMLLTDALTDRTMEGGRTREAVLDVLQGLQMPSDQAARGPDKPIFRGRVPFNTSAYPIWYPR